MPAALLSLAAFPLLFSCAKGFHEAKSRTSHLIRDVPFYPQEAHQCGPASLAGVLHYWGVDASPGDIAREICSKSAGGTLGMDMAFYAKRVSLKSCQYRGSLEDLKGHIDSDCPLIVLVDYGFWVFQRNHFMVVVGYDENNVIVNSGEERLKTMPVQGFLNAWEKTGFWTLLITPGFS
jgi:ABC-type bacteriocin/lantibiotic exporter with double-glycine peptidase domain